MKWTNYGDLNFAEHGGVLLKPVENHSDQFEFIEVRPTEHEHLKVGYKGIVYTSDWDDKKNEIFESAGLSAEASNEDYALAIVEYEGGYDLGGSPLIYNSIANDISDYQGYSMLSTEVCEYFKDMDIDRYKAEDKLSEFANLSDKDLADELEDYFYIRQSPDLDSDAERWKMVDKIAEQLDTSEGLAELSANIKDELTFIDKTDELFEKCYILDKALDSRIEKMQELLNEEHDLEDK